MFRNRTAGKPGYFVSFLILWTIAAASNTGSTSSSTTFTRVGRGGQQLVEVGSQVFAMRFSLVRWARGIGG